MPPSPRHAARRTAAVVLATALALAPAAAASPQQVVADYVADGRIDGSYPAADLHGALALSESSPTYGALADAVTERLTESLAGVRDSRQAASEAPLRGASAPAVASALPDPPPAGPDSGPPLVVPAAAAAAALLLLAGGGSAVYRRVRG